MLSKANINWIYTHTPSDVLIGKFQLARSVLSVLTLLIAYKCYIRNLQFTILRHCITRYAWCNIYVIYYDIFQTRVLASTRILTLFGTLIYINLWILLCMRLFCGFLQIDVNFFFFWNIFLQKVLPRVAGTLRYSSAVMVCATVKLKQGYWSIYWPYAKRIDI